MHGSIKVTYYDTFQGKHVCIALVFRNTHYLAKIFTYLTKCFILFVVIAAGAVLCGCSKKQPCTSSIVQFIFFFWSLEISGNILRNQKFV